MEITEQIATEQVVSILEPHRRTMGEITMGLDNGLAALQQRVEAFVTSNQPVHLVLPAFPCKSVSHRKVLGELPDMAEELSLKFLDSICRKIRQVHAPGARLTICSDGRVFSPIVRVSDEAVSNYSSELRQLTERLGLTALGFFHLEDVFSGSKEQLRGELLGNFGTSVDELQQQARENPSLMNTWLGITRFMFEEGTAWNEQQGIVSSNNQRQKDAKDRAWRVVQASQAWAALCDTEQFPDAVRLSIHPQGADSEKFGITLLPTRDSFLTPWHGVAVLNQDGARLVRRSDLKDMSGKMHVRHGRPYHFEESG